MVGTTTVPAVIGEEFPEVLRQAQAGERDAVGRLYADCAPRVLGFLRAQGIADHEDVAAEVFVSVVRNLPRFSGDEDAFRGWVFTIAQRRLIDERRRRGRRPEEPFENGDLTDVVGAGPGVEGEAMDRLRTSGLLAAIEELTPDQRAVLYLRAVADLSVPEIARVLDKPETAVRSLLWSAVPALESEPDGEPSNVALERDGEPDLGRFGPAIAELRSVLVVPAAPELAAHHIARMQATAMAKVAETVPKGAGPRTRDPGGGSRRRSLLRRRPEG